MKANNIKLKVVKRLLHPDRKIEIHIDDASDGWDEREGRKRFEVSVWVYKDLELDELIEPIYCFKEELDDVLDKLQKEYIIPEEDIWWI